jgi:hypothetical protein
VYLISFDNVIRFYNLISYVISIQVEGLMVKCVGADIENRCDEYGGDRGYDLDGENGRKKNVVDLELLNQDP